MAACVREELAENEGGYTRPFLAWLDAFPARQLYLVQVGLGVGWGLAGGGTLGLLQGQPCRRPPAAASLLHGRWGCGADSVACCAALRCAVPALQYENMTAKGVMEGVVADVKQ